MAPFFSSNWLQPSCYTRVQGCPDEGCFRNKRRFPCKGNWLSVGALLCTRIERQRKGETPRTWGGMIRRVSSVRIFIFIFLVQIVADTAASRASDARNSSSDLLREVRRVEVPLTLVKTFEYCLCDNIRCDLRDPVGVKGVDIVASCVQVASDCGWTRAPFASRVARLFLQPSRYTCASPAGVVVVVGDDEDFGQGRSQKKRSIYSTNHMAHILRISCASYVARPPARRT